jgi:hypothetical protein
MKFTRTLGLALVGATAAMALLGVSSAMANTSTSLCKVSTNPCPAASLYPSGTVVEGLAVKPILLGTFSGFTGTVECEHSVVAGTTTSALATPLKGKITSISFTGKCHSTFGGTCKVTTVKMGELDLLRTGANVGTATSLGNEIHVECGGFPTINCTFGGTPTLKVEGSPAKTLKAEGATLTGSGTACPTNPRWDATYSIINPSGSVFINE